MKLSLRYALSAFIVFLLLFCASGVALIETGTNQRLQDQRQTLTQLNYNMDSLLSTIAPMYQIYNFSESVFATIEKMQTQFLSQPGTELLSVKITDIQDEQSTQSNFPLTSLDEELQGIQENSLGMKIMTRDETTYLVSARIGSVYFTPVHIWMALDISQVLVQRENQYYTFMMIGAVAAVIYLITMLWLSRRLMKPIHMLNQSEALIAGGQWDQRVEIHSKDELAELGQNFNIMAEKVESTVRQLQQGNADKEIFINNLSHELKTPLTSVIGYTQLLRKTQLDEKTRDEALQVIEREGRRMEVLSTKLMELIIARQPLTQLKVYCVSELFLQVKSRMEFQLQEKQLELVQQGNVFSFNMDLDLMTTALVNLVDNAIKASKVGQKIVLRWYAEEKSIQVCDQGCGIKDTQPEHMLEPFVMEDKARSHRHKGSGLGLALTKRIVEAHHGTIQIHSQVNEGTTVTLVFSEVNL